MKKINLALRRAKAISKAKNNIEKSKAVKAWVKAIKDMLNGG